MATERVELCDGILYKGERHTTVIIRTPTVGDNIQADDQSKDKSALYFSLALMVACIVKIGTTDENDVFVSEIPHDALPPDMLLQLSESDLELLQVARDFLKKKVAWTRKKIPISAQQ
jgi:hypothetical protein